MPIILLDERHKSDLSLLIDLPLEGELCVLNLLTKMFMDMTEDSFIYSTFSFVVVAKFSEIAIEFIRKGANKKAFSSAAR
jgi:hypothetical protein